MRKYFLLFVLIFCFLFCKAQSDDSLTLFQSSPVPNKSRLRTVNFSTAILYSASMSWLYSQWYSGYPKSSFHFFNDNGEWLQMDKYAHFFDAYIIAKPMTHVYKWAGLNNTKATLYGCGVALLFQTTVEVFDGFSSEWGFSTGDLACNTGGVLLFGAQQLGWKEQRIMLKYSFHQTKYSQYRPDVLGSNLQENILKDYNGLTSWICVNPYSFMNKNSKFPKWLNFAVGFGGEGMTGGDFNPSEINGVPIPEFTRYRQYYLALDIELSKINTRSEFINGLFKLLNIIHLPMPTIEFSSVNKPIGRVLYF